MAPYYATVCQQLSIPLESGILIKMQAKNNQKLKEFDEKIEDAIKNLGETEHSDALIAKALYLAEIGEKVT